jgi:hypothetical protein
MNKPPIIPDRAEFVDALDRLRRGHVLVKVGDSAGSCVLDGGIVWRSYEPLVRYGLIDAYENPEGFRHVRYYRLSARGQTFAEQACRAWRSRPLWQRLAVRLAG